MTKSTHTATPGKVKAKATSAASKERKSATPRLHSLKSKALPMPGAEAKRPQLRTRVLARSTSEFDLLVAGEILVGIRRLIHEADPDIVEECKWVKPTNPKGVPM